MGINEPSAWCLCTKFVQHALTSVPCFRIWDYFPPFHVLGFWGHYAPFRFSAVPAFRVTLFRGHNLYVLLSNNDNNKYICHLSVYYWFCSNLIKMHCRLATPKIVFQKWKSSVSYGAPSSIQNLHSSFFFSFHDFFRDSFSTLPFLSRLFRV